MNSVGLRKKVGRAVAVLVMALLAVQCGCDIIGGGDAGRVSPGDVSGAEAVEAAAAPSDENEDFEEDYIMFDAIPSTWDKAEDDAEYEAGVARRADEYIQMLAAMGSLIPALRERCGTVGEVGRDGNFLALSASMIQWANIVEAYDTEDMPEKYAERHGMLVDLAGITRDYLLDVPGIVISGDDDKNGEYTDQILDILVKIK